MISQETIAAMFRKPRVEIQPGEHVEEPPPDPVAVLLGAPHEGIAREICFAYYLYHHPMLVGDTEQAKMRAGDISAFQSAEPKRAALYAAKAFPDNPAVQKQYILEAVRATEKFVIAHYEQIITSEKPGDIVRGVLGKRLTRGVPVVGTLLEAERRGVAVLQAESEPPWFDSPKVKLASRLLQVVFRISGMHLWEILLLSNQDMMKRFGAARRDKLPRLLAQKILDLFHRRPRRQRRAGGLDPTALVLDLVEARLGRRPSRRTIQKH